jgi:hypothetical protein
VRLGRTLEDAYRDFLDRHGVRHLVSPPLDVAEQRARAERLIREMRETAAAEGAPYEGPPSVDWLLDDERLGGHGSVVRDLADDIERMLARRGIALPPVYAAEFPHGSFNARACPVAEGTLLLVNTGLMQLIREAAMLWCLSIRWIKRDKADRMQPTTDLGVSSWAPEDISQWFAAIVMAYLLGDVRAIPALPAQGGPRGLMGMYLCEMAETFVVAHEYGHVLAGHVGVPRPREDGEEWIRKSHEQELEADQLGVLLMLNASSKGEAGEGEWLSPFGADGPLFVFALHRLINRVRAEVPELAGPAPAGDHPPAEDRITDVRRLLVRLGDRDTVRNGDSKLIWVAGQEVQVLDHIRRQLAR